MALGFRRFPAAGLPLLVAAATLAALAFAGDGVACVCGSAPLEERLDEADAAFVGRLAEAERRGPASRGALVFEVEQQVKGALADRVEVRTLAQTDCALEVEPGRTVGLLLTREASGGWLATACSVVDPGRLVAAGGEPRGGAIKVVVGIVVLGLVLALAFHRLRRGSRPQLPGAPR